MHLSRKLLLAAVPAAVMLHAQTTPPAPGEALTFALDTKLVPLHVSVLDKNGKLVTNFPQSAFKVFENNVEQPLKIFNREDEPVSMGIIIDNSGSMREKRPKVAAAALELIKQSNPQDEVFVVDFNDEAYLDAPFTNNIKKLEQVLDKINTRGGTAMRNPHDTAKSQNQRCNKGRFRPFPAPQLGRSFPRKMQTEGACNGLRSSRARREASSSEHLNDLL